MTTEIDIKGPDTIIGLQIELKQLAKEKQALMDREDDLKRSLRRIENSRFMTELAQLCNKYGRKIHASASRDGCVDEIYALPWNGKELTADNVLDVEDH